MNKHLDIAKGIVNGSIDAHEVEQKRILKELLEIINHQNKLILLSRDSLEHGLTRTRVGFDSMAETCLKLNGYIGDRPVYINNFDGERKMEVA